MQKIRSRFLHITINYQQEKKIKKSYEKDLIFIDHKLMSNREISDLYIKDQKFLVGYGNYLTRHDFSIDATNVDTSV